LLSLGTLTLPNIW